MARSRHLAVRRAGLERMKANAALIAIVPAASQFPATVPAEKTWPFTKWGAPSATPLRGTCIDGSTGIFAVHGFSNGRFTGNTLIETAEDHACRIGDAIADALDGAILALDGGGEAKIRWTGDQLLQDPEEAGAYHTVQNFQVRRLI